MSLPIDSTDDPTAPGRRRRGRATAVALGVGTLLVVGGYAAAVYAVSSQDIPAGTSVMGVDIGGQSTAEAAQTLEAELGDAAAEPIPVTAGEAATELDPTESGLAVDWTATAEQAAGLVLDPRDLIAHLRGEVEYPPVTTIDRRDLTESLSALAVVAALEPVEPRIRYTKKAVAKLVNGVPGTQLDVPAALDVVATTYLQVPYEPVALPMNALPPLVSDVEAQRVFDEFAEPAVALPVTVRVTNPSSDAAAQVVRVPPTAIAEALTFEVEGSTLVPMLNGEELHAALDDELADVERPGRDAAIVIRSGAPAVVPSRTGLAVDPDDLADAVLPVLPELTGAQRVATVVLTVAQPDFTTAEARALNITEKLSSFRQAFPPAAYRYQNVGQAAEYLNGTILEPGQTFSMNDTIKERTPANGYTEGFIISGGRFREELGGGVSIITTATWTAGFYAGLERVEQHAHGLYISRYEAGLEATVAWGLLDLKMRNDTGNGVLITATRFTDGVLIEMWGTKKFDQVTASFTDRYNYTNFQTITDDGARCVPSEGVRGFSISVTRRRFVGDQVVSTETWPTTYKPTPNVICTSPNASSG